MRNTGLVCLAFVACAPNEAQDEVQQDKLVNAAGRELSRDTAATNVSTLVTGPNLTGIGTASSPLDLAPDIAIQALNIGFGTAPDPLPAAPVVTENWNPWGSGPRTSLVRVVTAQGGSILGSLVGGKVGDIVVLENHGDGSGSYGAGDLKILFRRTTDGNIVANHIYQPNLTDTVIPYTGAIVLYYDAANVGWIPIAMSIGGKFERMAVDEISIAHPLTPTPLPPTSVADFDPGGGQFGAGQKTATWLRLCGDASGTSTLTGLVPYYQPGPTGQPQGPIKIIENVGGPITLAAEDPSSSPANRFASPNGSITIPPNGIQVLIYDNVGGGVVSQARWRVVSSTGMFSKVTLYRSVTDVHLTAVVDDYCPTGFVTTTRLRLAPSGPTSDLSGLCAQEDGALRTITAYGPGLTLKHQARSAQQARFFLPNASDLPIPIGGSVTLVYDGIYRGWFVLSRST